MLEAIGIIIALSGILFLFYSNYQLSKELKRTREEQDNTVKMDEIFKDLPEFKHTDNK